MLQLHEILIPNGVCMSLKNFRRSIFSLILALGLVACSQANPSPVISQPSRTPQVEASLPGQSPANGKLELTPLPGKFLFTEGPAVDRNGAVYFSDIDAGKIYKWKAAENTAAAQNTTPVENNLAGSVTLFKEGLNRPNGLAFDQQGHLIACEGGSGSLISIDAQGLVTVLASQYKGIRFNEPNDLWIDPHGGIYFTDPAYQSPVVQGGQYVYYLLPDRSQVLRLIDDLAQPNGIIGTEDGKTLYVADYGARKTYAYNIDGDGRLSNKRLLISSGSDGMALDVKGNLYLTTSNRVRIYDSAGNHLQDIPIPEDPTNVAFTGNTLFITARTAVYIVQMAGLSARP